MMKMQSALLYVIIILIDSKFLLTISNFISCTQILNQGDFQVSEKEREVAYATTFKEIASFISERCINTATKKPISVSLIENSLRAIHYSVQPRKSAKKQALDALRALTAAGLPIARAQMRLAVSAPSQTHTQTQCTRAGAEIETREIVSSNKGEEIERVVVRIDPGRFRALCEALTGTPGVAGIFIFYYFC